MKKIKSFIAIFLTFLLLFQCMNFSDISNINSKNVYAVSNGKLQSNSIFMVEPSSDNTTVTNSENIVANQSSTNINISNKNNTSYSDSSDNSDNRTDRFIIKYKNQSGSNNLNTKLKKQIKKSKKLNSQHFNNGIDSIVFDTKMTTDELLGELKDQGIDSTIEYIEPDKEVILNSNDSYFTNQWGLQNSSVTQEPTSAQNVGTDVVSAWSESQGEGAVVAVIDTGIDITHEDLKENIFRNSSDTSDNSLIGYNFIDNNDIVHSSATAADEQHGTHIAGIIAAVKDNNVGISGVAPKSKIMPLKAFSNGVSNVSSIIEAIDYAEKMGAKIANISWVSTGDSIALREAIQNSPMLFVCAAGNYGMNNDTSPEYPASYNFSNVISVASIDRNGQISSFSNYGANSVSVAAPGQDIISTIPGNGYIQKSGTSMATAFVTGEAALILSKYGSMSASQIKDRIMSSSDHLLSLTGKVTNGNKINCGRALGIQTNVSGDIPISVSTSSAISVPQSNTSTSSSISINNNIPTAPGNLNVTTKTAISVTLSWTASTGNMPVAGYEIYDEDKLVGTTTGGAINFTVTNLKENTMHSFTVKSKDAAGNVSKPSNVVKITTDNANALISPQLQSTDPSNSLPRNITDYFGKSGIYAPTGNYSRTFTDRSIPSPGFTLNINRTYNSLDSNVGNFGKGWSSMLEAKLGFADLVEQPLNRSYYNQLNVRLPDGSTEKFTVSQSTTETRSVWEGGVLNTYTYTIPIYYASGFSRSKIYFQNNGNSYILTQKNHYSYGFDYYGHMIWMEDNNGNRVNVSTNADGQVYRVTDTANRTLTYNYNSQHRVSSITDSENRTFTYSYDSNGNLITVTDPMQHTITYSYDDHYMLNGIKDKNLNLIESITYIHDGGSNNNKVLQETDEYGNVHNYTYDIYNKKTTIIDSNSRKTEEYYDSNFFIISTVDAEGKTVNKTYNYNGEVVSETDRNGNTTIYTRDNNGNIIDTKNPDGSHKTKTYDSNNNIISEVDENGNYTFYNYDASNNLITKAQPINGKDQFTGNYDTTKFAITNYSYYSGSDSGCNAKGLLKSVSVMVSPTETDTTTYIYDVYGNISTITDPEGKITTNTYNSIGWKLNSKSPRGFNTSYTYDSNGNVEKQQLNNGETTRVIYDNNGRKVKSVAPNQYSSSLDNIPQHSYSGDCGYRYTYYSSGKIQTVTDPENNITKYTYDIYGNMLTETKPSKAVYKYEYDVMNRPTKYYVQEDSNSPWTLLEEYSYKIVQGTPAQTQKTVTKHLNDTETAVTVTTYDYAGRVITVKNPDSTQSSNVYNSNGTVSSTTDPRGSVTYYRYDGLNRQTEKWMPIDASLYTYSIKIYNNAGRVVSEKTGKDKVALWSVPGNFVTLNYSYYKNGKIKSTVDGEGRKKEYSYDNDGNIARENDYTDTSNFIATDYTYNQLGKPLTKSLHVRQGDISGNDISNTSDKLLTTTYVYDSNGNLKTMTTPDNITTTYAYDKVDRQTSISMPGTDGNGYPVTITKLTAYNWDGNPLVIKDAKGNTTTNTYSNRGLLIKVTDANGGISKYEYDTAGRKIREVSPKNYIEGLSLSAMNHTEYTYDLMNRLKTKIEVCVNTSGAVTKSIVTKAFRYDANGNTTKELDALGYEAGNSLTVDGNIANGYGIITSYNLQNKVSTILDAESKARNLSYTTKYDYDALGRKIAETNANGVITNYYYDDVGNIKRVTLKKASGSPEVTQKTMTYNYLGNLLTSIDGNSNTITYEYNALGKVRKVTYPGDNSIPSNTITYQYDVYGNLKNKADTAGTVDYYNYNSQNKEISHVQYQNGNMSSTGITTSTSYDVNGNKVFESLSSGNFIEKTKTSTYDSLNRLKTETVSVTNSSGIKVNQTTTYDYDKNGNLITTTDWRGNKYTNKYDSLNRLIEKDNPYCAIEKIEYNDNDVQVASYDALNRKTVFQYDKNNRLLSTIDPEQHITSQTYDNVGNISSKFDGKNTISYQYDEFNRLVQVKNAKNEITVYTYDLNNNKLSETNGKGNTTNFEYNCQNKLIRKIDQGGRTGTAGSYTYNPAKTEKYTYYCNGNLNTKTDRNGNTTKYVYDSHGRLLSETVGSSVISYTYDARGNQLTVNDSTGVTQRSYDELSRVTKKIVPNIGEIDFQYDIIPNRPELQYGVIAETSIDPKGNKTTKVYDAAGRIKYVLDGDISSSNITTYSYYDNGSVQSIVYPNGTREEYTYYNDNLLKTLINKKADGTIIESYSYEYDAVHNMTKKVDKKGTTSYTYDVLNRLLSVTEPTGIVTSYTYDGAGNRLTETKTQNGTTISATTYNYNEQNRLLTARTVQGVNIVTETYIYDNNGNTTYKGKATETQAGSSGESFNVSVSGETGSETSNNVITFYSYDVFNNLVNVTTGTHNYSYQYNGEGLRVSKTVDGQLTRYLYEYDKPILELNGSGNQVGRNIYGTNLVSRIVDNQKLYYLYNGHADVTALVDSSGVVQGTYYYDAFGNITETTGSIKNPIRYAGYQYDDEIGLYYCNARMYDPKIARFLNEDTYGGDPNDPLSLNRYTYCVNNPLIYYDPTGHWPDWLDNAFRYAESQAEKALNDTYNSMVSSWAETKETVSSAWNSTTDTISSAFNYTTDMLSSAWNTTTDIWSSSWNSPSSWSSSWNSTRNTWSSSLNSIGDKWSSSVGNISNTWSNSFNSINDSWKSSLSSIGSNLNYSLNSTKNDISSWTFNTAIPTYDLFSGVSISSADNIGHSYPANIDYNGTVKMDSTPAPVLGPIMNRVEMFYNFEKNGLLSTMAEANGQVGPDGNVYITEDDVKLADFGANYLTGEGIGNLAGVAINGIRSYKVINSGEQLSSEFVAGSGLGITAGKGAAEATGRMNMAGKTHPVSGVEFDASGFPKFKSEYGMHLEPEDYLKSRGTHFDRASKSLYDEIQSNSELASKFTQNEIDIFKEGGVPKRFTWHHNQEPGLMQLVDRTLHRQTGHDGGFSIWGPGNK
ncbi:S8 family serine peptidase [Clostridium sp. DJ247]|uniref:S8 family serine peptidase n=1 Tax=Clostridium sp. DJ247 TaxID=2726188 RepID=UPI0016245FB9|nr:S8 family serine peptidase [Clostridium sp. DJ247]MBC2581762.1 S8 family serine peptidase [Clostridium sp. DJ247]